tara:strand:- start:12282 stop:12728 length:447 start_codon:yes stop_codon:yes gene_type:complete
MTNPELISFYDAHSRLKVRAKRDGELLVEIQYRKKSTFNGGTRYLVQVGFHDIKPTLSQVGHEAGFDHRGVRIKTDRAGVEKVLEECLRKGHISQTTMTLMLAAIDDQMLRSSGSTGLDAGAGWVKMIDGEPKWGYMDMDAGLSFIDD